MTRDQVIEYLKAERDQLMTVIAMLEGGQASAKGIPAVSPKGKRSRRARRIMSPETRARIAAATKARWARFRKAKGK